MTDNSNMTDKEIGDWAIAELDKVGAQLRTANKELAERNAAINKTLRLADSLKEMARQGVGFNDYWGERVTQEAVNEALRPLRNVEAFAGETLQHNRVLVEANGKLLQERDDALSKLTTANEKIEYLEYELLVIGDMAVVNLDDKVVGAVDNIAGNRLFSTYAEKRRAEIKQFKYLKEQLKLANDEIDRLSFLWQK